MFTCSCKFAIVLAALLGTPLTASAALVQFDFSGEFTNSATVLGLTIDAGQTLTGTMSYDSALASAPLFAGSPSVYLVPAPYKVDLSFNGNTFESNGFLVWAAPSLFLEIASQGVFGVVDPTVYATLNGAPANAAFQIDFQPNSQNTFSSLPENITNTVGANGYLTDANQNFANFDISNIAVATVPLPASDWLLGSALIGLIGVVCKRKAA